jgi:hypothetical protein
MLALSAGVLAAGAEAPEQTCAELKALNEEVYGRRWEGGERVRVHDRPGSTIIEPLQIPDSHELGMLDLLEGVAVLESFKLCTSGATVHDFLGFRDDWFPGELQNPYRWAFNWLGSDIGAEAAYELLAPVSYVSLQHDDPAAVFVRLSERLAQEDLSAGLDGLTDPAALAALVGVDESTPWFARYAQGEPDGGHVTLDPGITAAVAELGALELARIGAAPNRAGREHFEVLAPPLTVFAGVGGLEYQVARYADEALTSRIIAWTACAGAAERLTAAADTDVYRFCPHRNACPHAHSALCQRYFAPPSVSRDWRSCGFIALVESYAGTTPEALWVATGRGRKSAAELLEAFEASGEGNIAPLCRLQRESLVAEFGEERYQDLLNQCDMVADQTLRALQTRDMNEAIQAKMFHAAVVEQVRKLAERESA